MKADSLSWDRPMDLRPLLRLRPFSGADEHLLQQAVRVYAATWDRPWAWSYEHVRNYARSADFRGILAEVEGGQGRAATAVGMGFGHRCSVGGDWWCDRVAREVGPAHPALQQAWVLVELAVRPASQGQGIGTRLHDALLAAQPLPRAVLSTAVDNRAAQRFYLRLGWTYLHERGFVFGAGQPPYVVMRKELARGEQAQHRLPTG